MNINIIHINIGALDQFGMRSRPPMFSTLVPISKSEIRLKIEERLGS